MSVFVSSVALLAMHIYNGPLLVIGYSISNIIVSKKWFYKRIRWEWPLLYSLTVCHAKMAFFNVVGIAKWTPSLISLRDLIYKRSLSLIESPGTFYNFQNHLYDFHGDSPWTINYPCFDFFVLLNKAFTIRFGNNKTICSDRSFSTVEQ